MGLGASGFPLDLPSPGLMPLPEASQAPHEHAAAPAGVASRLILAACLMHSLCGDGDANACPSLHYHRGETYVQCWELRSLCQCTTQSS